MHDVDSQSPLERFAQTVLESALIWGLKGEDGWAVCASIEFEDTDVMPFFSSQQAAQALCHDEWQDYTPHSIKLEEFIDDWLPGMHEDDVMLGLDWNTEMEGLEAEPADLAAAFA